MSKNSFILHNDSLDVLDELTNEQAGMLLKAMRAFHCGEELELDTLTKIVFSPFKNQFDRDEIKYQKITDRNKVNGEKGGRPKGSGSNNYPEASSKGHFLYLIKDIYNDQFKIGETQNLKKRVYDIKRPTASLEVLHYWELDRQTAINLEKSFKDNFINQSAGGDWFNDSPLFVNQAVTYVFERTQWVSKIPKEPDNVNGSVNDSDNVNGNGNGIKVLVQKQICTKSIFEEVWKQFPTKQNKKKAQASFESYLNKNKKVDPIAFGKQLHDDICKRCELEQFGFDKLHFTTYMNGERFNDDYPIEQNSSVMMDQYINGLDFSDVPE